MHKQTRGRVVATIEWTGENRVAIERFCGPGAVAIWKPGWENRISPGCRFIKYEDGSFGLFSPKDPGWSSCA